MTDEEKRADIYAACFAAATLLGHNIKRLSWFGSNRTGVV